MPTVKDLLARKGAKVYTTVPSALVLEATRLMNEHRIGSLLVTEKGVVVGIFTERDVLTRIVAAGRDPATTRVSEAMSSPVAFCTPDMTLDELRAIFTERRIRHMPVLEDEKLVGLVTGGDVLAHDISTKEQTIRYLEEYIQTP